MPQASRRRLAYANAAILLGTFLLVALIWTIAEERVDFEYRQSMTDVENDTANLSLLVEARTRAVMGDVDQALRALRRQYAIDGSATNPAQLLQDLGIDTPAMKAITVLDAKGDVAPTRAAPPRAQPLSREVFAQLASGDTDTPYVGLTRPDGPAGEQAMDVARRMFHEDGTFAGVVVAAVDPVQLASLYGLTSLGAHDMIQIMGTDGIVRVRRTGEQVGFGQDMHMIEAFKAASRAPVGRFVTHGTRDGTPRFVSYRVLGGLPLVVMVGRAEQEAFASFRGHKRSYHAVAGLATVALFVLSFVVLRALARQRRTLEALVSSESRFRATFDQAFVGMAQCTPEGELFKVNRTLCAITGYPDRELLGRKLADIVHPEDRGASEPAASGAPVELRLLHEDGRVRWASVTTTRVPDGHGGVDCLVTVVEDITEFKRIDRMKSEFVSTVSHELRTPLTSIRGSLGLIAGGVAGALPDAVKNLVEIAKSNCERLIRLINDMLDTEKIESGKMNFDMSELDLVALAQAAIEANQGFAGQHGVKLRLVAPGHALPVRADADRLTQVMTNLLSNAVKFSPDGSDVLVTIERRGRRARVEVRDHGPGVPDEFRDRIFQKFSQADSSDTRQKGGTGLGLNISKAIIDRLGGEIGFESVKGEGTTFHFELPEETGASIAASSLDSNRPRILVCEDDADIARLIAMMLDKAGYEADTVYTAAKARERVRLHRYDAITVDLKLPDEPGIALIRALRNDAATRELPVIVISAIAEEGRVQLNGEAHSVADWLGKPIDENRLVIAVRRAAGGAKDARPRVLHVEDDPDIQRIAAAIAQDFAAFEFAGGVLEARAMLRRIRFDLVLLDLELPDGSGWDLLPDIAAASPPPQVVVFSVHEVDAAARRRVAAVLVKSQSTNEQLLQTIRDVLNSAQPRAREG